MQKHAFGKKALTLLLTLCILTLGMLLSRTRLKFRNRTSMQWHQLFLQYELEGLVCLLMHSGLRG